MIESVVSVICFRGLVGIGRFGVSGVCLRWYLVNGEIAKVTDEERHALCKILHTMEPWPCKQAASEIERLAAENERLQNELRLWKEQG
jgi:hypothetical protein